ncbi:MAG: DUF4032 domain-containing protein [Propionibacteriaceae bacterium]|jgi:hypothetical protein|nr:DUF4032 domain-containing protein [Propionibacteriaceae bacterium]
MPRFLSSRSDSRLILLPWQLPLETWPRENLVALPRGISRHVVRFIKVGASVYAAKEVIENLALHEYRMLTDLRRLDAPAVEPVAVVTNRVDEDGAPLDPVLLTKHLEFSLPYRVLFDQGVRPETVTRLVDAMVVLLVRLHLIGFLWGDVSLSNVLFRRDAGAFAAYLVDAETAELHDALSTGQRENDLAIATINLYGEFLDLESGRMLDPSLHPLKLVDSIMQRYRDLWAELTGAEEFSGEETYRIENRVRRLNKLGFDVAELDLNTTQDGSTIRIQPKVVDAGHHSRRLLRLTGLDTEENQARRLLNDLATYSYRTGQQEGDEAVVAHRWLTECFQPVVNAIPPELHGKRDAAQLFHEILDYRWYQSEHESREVPLIEATHGYIRDVLHSLPDERQTLTQIAPHADERLPANPFDPSKGFAEDEEPMPADPWDTGEQPAVDPGFLDIAALRAKAKRKKR